MWEPVVPRTGPRIRVSVSATVRVLGGAVIARPQEVTVRVPMANRIRLGPVALALALTTFPQMPVGAGSAQPVDEPLPCPEVVARMASTLPAAAMVSHTARPADAWPAFDATTDMMFPASVLGDPVMRGHRRGADPVRLWDDGMPAGPTLATRLDRPDTAQHGVTNRDPGAVRSVFADLTPRLNIGATRVDEVTGAELLPEMVRHRLAGRTDVACEIREVAGLPVLYASTGHDRFAFVGYRDAWLVIDTVDETLQAILYEPPEPWEPERFDQAVVEVASVVAALPPVPVMPPLDAPDMATRVTPPGAAEHLTFAMQKLVQQDNPMEYFGGTQGMLGIGMVPGSALVDVVPSLQRVAEELGVDPSLVWGDVATGEDPLEVVAFIDPAGDGARWVEPLAAGDRGPSILMQERAGDGSVEESPRPMTTERWLGWPVRVITDGGTGDETVTAFYSDGPYVYQIHTHTTSALTAQDVVWLLSGDAPTESQSPGPGASMGAP